MFGRGGPAAARRAGVALLIAALLFAQMLGFAHRALHAPAPPADATAQQAPAPTFGSAGSVASLFGGHEKGTGDCRLYDQLGHGDVMPMAFAMALPSAIPAFRLHFSLGEALARWAAPFDARGPPSLR